LSVNPLKYNEHHDGYLNHEDVLSIPLKVYSTYFKKKRGKDLACFSIYPKEEKPYLQTGYFIGVDWIQEHHSAIYVAPKINLKYSDIEIDFTKMLFSALKHPEVSKGIDELFEVKWDQPKITIEQKEDLLTPFLVVEFLGLLKTIVRKGLKKSYYKIEKNLNSRIKGKVLIGKSIKKNIMRNQPLYTYCRFEEFGLNNKENRLLKKALVFIKRYLPTYAQLNGHHELQNSFNYINPAFQGISDDINLFDIKHTKTNVFYKEYDPALKLAKLILKRFGYNISNIDKTQINTPPFWIDMSKLFELYVLGLLKDRFNRGIKYHEVTYGNELDFLLDSGEYKIVIDAKYKLKYVDSRVHDDIRQVSGYARLNKVYNRLKVDLDSVIDCLIVYPDPLNGIEVIDSLDDIRPVKGYNKIYKLGIKLPTIS
jgi:5-methylcytosine-specific restriction enzyme subunit McrC